MRYLASLSSVRSFTSSHSVKHPVPQARSSATPTISRASSRLPEELIAQIIESAYYDEALEPDYKFLSSCALVCKCWSAPSQSLLFRHVSLHSSSAFVSFHSAVDPTTVRGQTLRSNVVRLQITIDHNHSNQLSHRALVAAILSCPNLYELDLTIYGCSVPGPSAGDATGVRIFRAAPSFDSAILDILRAGPSIRSLRFTNWSDNNQLACQLLSDVWPSLTAISLKGTAPRLPIFDNQPIPTFGCALTELRLDFQSMPCPDFVNWLLQSSGYSLRCLELERIPSTGFLGPLLWQFGRSLESLALPTCTSRDHVAAVQECEKLKEFRFESAIVSPLLLKRLPASVEHLAFSISRDTPLYLMVNFVKARRNLKAITAHVWDDAESHPQMPSLRIACASNGVKLLIVRGIRRFRQVVRADPVPCSSYPHLKEPANIRKMLFISRHERSPTRRQRPRAESAAAMFSRPVLSSPEFAATAEVFPAFDAHPEKL